MLAYENVKHPKAPTYIMCFEGTNYDVFKQLSNPCNALVFLDSYFGNSRVLGRWRCWLSQSIHTRQFFLLREPCCSGKNTKQRPEKCFYPKNKSNVTFSPFWFVSSTGALSSHNSLRIITQSPITSTLCLWAHSNNVLTFPNNVYRHTCCLSSVWIL